MTARRGERPPIPYSWAYERGSYDLNPAMDRMSLGVFQWLPKKSGGGLKKSTSIRIKGYAAEAVRVYDRANELCRKLNELQARIDKPPKWLQKSYSIPPPQGRVAGRFNSGLTGAQVRAARERVAKQLLLPAGFIKGDAGTYIRNSGNQIHIIDFQPDRWGGSYFVNMGFHYNFLPPLRTPKAIPLNKYHLLDCGLTTRLGTEYQYGDSVEAVRALLAGNMNAALRVFSESEKVWIQPRWFLRHVPSTQRTSENLILHWDIEEVLIPCIAIYLKQYRVADRLIAKLRSECDNEEYRKYLNAIIRRVSPEPRYRL